MTGLARNDAEVKAQLLPLIKQAVNKLMEYIAEDNKDMIERYVYEAYEPTEYERTMQFKEAWKADRAAITGDEVSAEFEFAPEMMTSIPEEFIHGSPAWGDVRDYMAEIIYQGKSGDLFGKGPWQYKRNAWHWLINHLGEKRFEQYLIWSFKSVGLTLRKG